LHSSHLLEVIACSLDDAIEAERGGASRLEIVSHLEVAGLTPPLSIVREIIAAVSIPARVMLRESDGFEVRDEADAARLCEIARELSGYRIDGLVLGFLKDGEIDIELTARILASATNLKATFHHAFDSSNDRLKSILILKGHPQIDRILTSGSDGDLPLQISNLESFARAARPEITILAGGGLNAARIAALRESTSITEFHVGRAVRLPAEVDGSVKAQLVKELLLTSGLNSSGEART
jgi:copper homeostasis protein